MDPSPQGHRSRKRVAGSGSGADSDSDPANNDTKDTSDKVLGKRRARTPPGSAPEAKEGEDSLSDADADWEPEDAFELAPKFVRLESEPQEEPEQQSSSQPGPSTTRGARGLKPVARRPPRTRSSGREGSPVDYDALPNEAPRFTCGWVPLEHPVNPPCIESCTRLSDLRRHQRPHFEIDLKYAKEHLGDDDIAKARAAIDKCAGRGQSYACEFCGRVYSRLDAVARHRQQPQGKQCNIIYKRMRAAERNRARESQELGPEIDKDAEKDVEKDTGTEENVEDKEREKKTE